MSQLFENFQMELKNHNYSRNTIRVYTKCIRKFLNFIKDNFNNEQQKIISYLNYIASPEMRRINYNAIKTFYNFTIHKPCPYQLIKVKTKKRLPNVLNHEEIIKVLNNISNTIHYLIIAMLYGSGLRISEVVKLKVNDLNIKELTLTVRGGKGNKDRITVFSEKILPKITELIKNKIASNYLFTTIHNKQYSVRTVQKILENALKKSGVSKKASCHTLRHSFATNLIRNGEDIRIVKALMGHQSIKTTMIYLHLTDSEKKRVKSPL